MYINKNKFNLFHYSSNLDGLTNNFRETNIRTINISPFCKLTKFAPF